MDTDFFFFYRKTKGLNEIPVQSVLTDIGDIQ